MRKLAIIALMWMTFWPLSGQEVITARRRAVSAGAGTWSKVQNAVSNSGSGTTISAVLASPPGTGDTLLVWIGTINAEVTASITCGDGSGHNFTIATAFGSFVANTLFMYGGYILQTASGTGATISCTIPTSTGFMVIIVSDYHDTGGTPVFDATATVGSLNNSSSGANAITAPAITPTVSGELLEAGIIPGDSINTPSVGGTQGVWTGGANILGSITEYLLSSTTSSTPINATDNSASDPYAALVIGIKP